MAVWTEGTTGKDCAMGRNMGPIQLRDRKEPAQSRATVMLCNVAKAPENAIVQQLILPSPLSVNHAPNAIVEHLLWEPNVTSMQ